MSNSFSFLIYEMIIFFCQRKVGNICYDYVLRMNCNSRHHPTPLLPPSLQTIMRLASISPLHAVPMNLSLPNPGLGRSVQGQWYFGRFKFFSNPSSSLIFFSLKSRLSGTIFGRPRCTLGTTPMLPGRPGPQIFRVF